MSATVALALMLMSQAALSAADLADAKCIVAMSFLREHAEAKDKPDMQSAMLFFVGKIVGRSGSAGVAPALQAVVEPMKSAGVEGTTAIAEQCAPQIKDAANGL